MFIPDKNLFPPPTISKPVVSTPEPNPLSIEGLIAWLETKDPREEYCYLSPGSCIYAQYGTYCGYGEGEDGYRRFLAAINGDPRKNRASHEPFNDRGPDLNVAQGGDRTFGAALDRARAYAAGTP